MIPTLSSSSSAAAGPVDQKDSYTRPFCFLPLSLFPFPRRPRKSIPGFSTLPSSPSPAGWFGERKKCPIPPSLHERERERERERRSLGVRTDVCRLNPEVTKGQVFLPSDSKKKKPLRFYIYPRHTTPQSPSLPPSETQEPPEEERGEGGAS